MDVFGLLTTTYWGGLIWIGVGAFFIWKTVKYPTKKPDWFATDMKGWAAGVGGILIGITILIAKLVGKL